MYAFIVEGVNDKDRLRKILPNAHIIVIRGTRYSGRVIKEINTALNNFSAVFLLVDPDKEGDYFARNALRDFPQLIHIQLDREQCLSPRIHRTKVGVEHTTHDYLSSVLECYV